MRVSVKALALSCVGAAVALCPESFFSKLYRAPPDAAERPGTRPPPAPAPALPGALPHVPCLRRGSGPPLTGPIWGLS